MTLEESASKIIVDRSRRGPQSVPVLHAMGWRRPRLRSIALGARNQDSSQSWIYSVRALAI